MLWYYAENGQQKGPVEETALDQMVAAGVIGDETQVWREGMANWQTHASVRGPKQAVGMPTVAASEETRYCTVCARAFSTRDLVALGPAFVCAECKPIFLQRLREGGVAALGPVRYAGFWVRFVARLIDGVLLGIAGLIIRIPFGVAMVTPITANDPRALRAMFAGLGIVTLINLVLVVTYEAYFLSTKAATPGKMVFGLKVLRPDGSMITAGRAVGRYFATFVSSIILGIGYLMAAFDDEKRALHDRICDTRVVYSK